MKDVPILFSAPMIRALLAGRKTMTRRLAWRDCDGIGHDCPKCGGTGLVPTLWQKLHHLIQGGETVRIWVKETWAPLHHLTHNDPGTTALINGCFYRADDPGVEGEISKWKPSIFMPRWASRITIVDVQSKLEPLQDISEEDSKAEGTERPILPHWPGSPFRSAFRGLWNSLHGSDAWQENPDVIALSGRVVLSNIDCLANG